MTRVPLTKMSPLLAKRITYSSVAALSALGIWYYQQTSSKSKTMLPPYKATYSVPLTCDSCVDDISAALSKLSGIHSIDISLSSQLVTTTGTAPPSAIMSSIQSTGRPAILRGSGASNDAAVCILELPVAPAPSSNSNPSSSPIRGLVRLVKLSPSFTLLDLSLSGLTPGTYQLTLRTTGDISLGATNMGAIWQGEERDKEGMLGEVVIDNEGKGGLVHTVGWRVEDMIGRGIVVQKVDGTNRAEARNDDTVVGVVARSAGIWENEKMVCSCSGKTVWEERAEMVGKGIV